MLSEIVVNFRLHYRTEIEERLHVATCDVLGLQSTGFTREEARDNLREEIGLYLTAAHDIGSLPDLMAEAGWQKTEGEPAPGEPMIKVSERPVAEAEADDGDGIWISLPLAYLMGAKRKTDVGFNG